MQSSSRLDADNKSLLTSTSGTAQKAEGQSWRGLVAASGYSVVINFAQILVFVLVRRRFLRVYQPRTFLVAKYKRIAAPRDDFPHFLMPVWSTSDAEIIEKCGLDAYLFIRYLRMILLIFGPICVVLLPSLLSINAKSGGANPAPGLDVLSISNVAAQFAAVRFWAHLVLGYMSIVWFCIVIYKELKQYVRTKQSVITTTEHRLRASASSIMIRDLPQTYRDDAKGLKQLFDVFPGGVKRVWINRNHDKLAALVRERDKVLQSLEESETEMIQSCHEKARAGVSVAEQSSVAHRALPTWRWVPRCCRHHALAEFLDKNKEPRAKWRHYISPRDRRTATLPIFDREWCPAIPFIGFRVDRIQYLRFRLARLNLTVSNAQHDRTGPGGSAFIQFNRQIAAHMACQSVTHHLPHVMTSRMIEVGPSDVLWDNLSLTWYQRSVRLILSVLISSCIIIFFAVPVAFTSLISKLDVLAVQVSWLHWLGDWPAPVKGAVQGLLPPALLQLLLVIVPILYRYLIDFQGVPTSGKRELSVQSWYFVFLFSQVFLVVTVSGGLIGILSDLANSPKSVGVQLAQAVPKAANYFFSYFVVRGLSNSASTLLQVTNLVGWLLTSTVPKKTARQKSKHSHDLPTIQWGTFWPPFTNFAVIGMIFSVIAPLILVFVIVMFGLFWAVFRYNVLYVYEFQQDTGGLLFPAAINQLFTGLYVMEICLCGFFFTTQDSEGRTVCAMQGALMLVALGSTATFQLWLNSVFRPLLHSVPVTLEEDSVRTEVAETRPKTFQRILDKFRGDVSHHGASREESFGNGKDFTYEKSEVHAPCTEPTQLIDDPEKLEHLDLAERDRVLERAFEHPVARAGHPKVWLPKDNFGVSDDQVVNGDAADGYLFYSNDRCLLDDSGKIVVEGSPPDLDHSETMCL